MLLGSACTPTASSTNPSPVSVSSSPPPGPTASGFRSENVEGIEAPTPVACGFDTSIVRYAKKHLRLCVNPGSHCYAQTDDYLARTRIEIAVGPKPLAWLETDAYGFALRGRVAASELVLNANPPRRYRDYLVPPRWVVEVGHANELEVVPPTIEHVELHERPSVRVPCKALTPEDAYTSPEELNALLGAPSYDPNQRTQLIASRVPLFREPGSGEPVVTIDATHPDARRLARADVEGSWARILWYGAGSEWLIGHVETQHLTTAKPPTIGSGSSGGSGARTWVAGPDDRPGAFGCTEPIPLFAIVGAAPIRAGEVTQRAAFRLTGRDDRDWVGVSLPQQVARRTDDPSIVRASTRISLLPTARLAIRRRHLGLCHEVVKATDRGTR